MLQAENAVGMVDFDGADGLACPGTVSDARMGLALKPRGVTISGLESAVGYASRGQQSCLLSGWQSLVPRSRTRFI